MHIYDKQCGIMQNKLASLEATLVRNYDLLTYDSLTGVKFRATSVAKNLKKKNLISDLENNIWFSNVFHHSLLRERM